MKLSTSQRAKVEKALAQHDRHAKSYFWTRNGNAATRRHIEKVNTWDVQFKHQGHTYRYESDVSVSCANYYYTGTFTVDGEKKTVRAFKGLLK